MDNARTNILSQVRPLSRTPARASHTFIGPIRTRPTSTMAADMWTSYTLRGNCVGFDCRTDTTATQISVRAAKSPVLQRSARLDEIIKYEWIDCVVCV